jgi:predicted dehydrogenase
MGRGFSVSTTRKKSVTSHFDKMAEPGLSTARASARPRVGFLGVGWIGRHRLKSIVESGAVEIAAVADFDGAAADEIAAHIPGAVAAPSLDALLGLQLDGLVIATPTALHAEQAIAALEKETAVFCQKPLGRSADETARVIRAARLADRLLAVDLSYRFVRGVQKIKQMISAGEIGTIYVADLVFHNAYGPDKAWYYEREFSGGGCLIDLGIHLIDLALWMLDFPAVENVSSRLFSQGKPVQHVAGALEDYALARLDLASGATVNLACSWRLPAGRDAVIRASFFGAAGGLSVQNVGGSFYDFRAERFQGTSRLILDQPPDPWGGRAAVAWAEQLSADATFDAQVERAHSVAQVIDEIYRQNISG